VSGGGASAGGESADGGVEDGGAGKGGRGGTAGRGGTGGNPATCPMRAPGNATVCTRAESGTTCDYGMEACSCDMQAGRLEWRCMRNNTGGAGGVGGAGGAGGANAANCPANTPMSGGMCTRATRPGQSNTCDYGTDECTCEAGATPGARATWACVTCPATVPMNGGMCPSAGRCTYTTTARTTICTCRAPVGGVGGAAAMTWRCL
jgi:hypothetical protein